jgi:tetratricopeptide (TPR) repeat protein
MMNIRKKRIFLSVISLLLVFTLNSCVSVEKRFKKGEQMENKGRFEEAARHYIKVLAKDPTFEDARERLENVGAKAIDIFLEQAYAYESAEAYEDAVRVLNRVDDLRHRAEKVGVILQVPDDYADFRQEMTAAAIDSLFNQGEYSEQVGDWTEALRKYERLKRLYPLSPSQNLRADQSRARVYTMWAEQDLAREYFRTAFSHAQKAIDIFGPGSGSSVTALEIQRIALTAGTRIVAVLPFWSSEGVEDEAPQGIVRELYDILLYEYLSEPVPFVALADPGKVHRELRRLRLRDKALTRNMAARVGQNLNTDFVIIGTMESYLQEEKDPQEKMHKVPLRKDKSSFATYLEKKYTARLTVEVKYQIIDSVRRRVIEEKTINTSASDKFRRGYFDGDYTTLDLSRSERRLFNTEEWRRAEQKLEERLIDQLAERLADSIYKRILGLIK